MPVTTVIRLLLLLPNCCNVDA